MVAGLVHGDHLMIERDGRANNGAAGSASAFVVPISHVLPYSFCVRYKMLLTCTYQVQNVKHKYEHYSAGANPDSNCRLGACARIYSSEFIFKCNRCYSFSSK